MSRIASRRPLISVATSTPSKLRRSIRRVGISLAALAVAIFAASLGMAQVGRDWIGKVVMPMAGCRVMVGDREVKDVEVPYTVRDVKDNWLDVGKGYVWYQQVEWLDASLLYYDEYLKAHSQDAWGYRMRGVAETVADDLSVAIVDFDVSLMLEPNNARTYKYRGDAWYAKREIDKAIADYDQAVRIDPNYVEAFSERGSALYDKGEFQRAIDDFNEAIRLDPTHGLAYGSRGKAWFDKGELDKAIADLDRSLEINPKVPIAYETRGEAWSRKGDFDKAIADFNRALELIPRRYSALCLRGDAYFNKQNYALALADYTAAIALHDDSAGVRNQRGRTYDNLGRADEAFADFDRAAELNPKWIWPLFNRARLHAARGEYESQIEDLEHAVGLDPKFRDAYVALTWAYATNPDASIRDGGKAVEAGTKACELSEWKIATDLGNLACAYAEAGDFESAVKWQTKAVESYSPELKQKWGFLLELFKSGRAYHQGVTPGEPGAGRPSYELVLQSGRPHTIDFLEVTRDGRYLVGGDHAGCVAIWDTATGRKVRVYHYPFRLNALAVSPDGKMLAVAGEEKQVVLRRLVTGELLRPIEAASSPGVAAIAFTPDSKGLFVATSTTGEESLRLWNVDERTVARSFSGAEYPRLIALSGDGRLVASHAQNGAVIVWEAVSGSKLHTFKQNGEWLDDLAFSPDSQKLAVVSSEGRSRQTELSLWDLPSGKKLRATSDARREYHSVAFSNDGRWILAGALRSEEGVMELRRWDAELERPETLTIPRNLFGGRRIVCHPDGKRCFAGGRFPNECRIEPLEFVRTLGTPAAFGHSVAFNPTRFQVIYATERGLMSWEPEHGAARMLVAPKPNHRILWCDITYDGRTLLAWEEEESVNTNIQTPRSRQLVRVNLVTGDAERCAPSSDLSAAYEAVMSRNGRIVVASDYKSPGQVYVYDALTGHRLVVFSGHKSFSPRVSISADGERIVSVGGTSDGGEAILWDAQTGKELRRLPGYKYLDTSGISPDGAFAFIGIDKEVLVWNLATGGVDRRFSVPSRVQRFVFSHDATKVAMIGTWLDPRIFLWDIATWKQIGVIETSEGIESASFSGNDEYLVTGNREELRLWNLATRTELARLNWWGVDEDWLLTAPDGRFECSEGAWDKFHFRVGKALEVRPAKEFAASLERKNWLPEFWEAKAAIAKSLEFPDRLLNTYPLRLAASKAWTNAESDLMRDICARAYGMAPGLWQRATAYRPLRLYRAPAGVVQLLPQTVMSANGIYIDDAFLSAADSPTRDLRAQTLLRCCVSLFDVDLRLSSGTEWSRLVGPRLAEVRRDAASQGLRLFSRIVAPTEQTAVEEGFTPRVVANGLPNIAACMNLESALAECTLRKGTGYAPPPEIASFLDEHLLRTPYAAEPRLRDLHTALERYAADDSQNPPSWDALVRDAADGGRAQLYRGLWAASHADDERAAADFAAVAKLLPEGSANRIVVALLLCEVLNRQGKREEALAILDKALTPELGTLPVLVQRATLYETSGEFEKAIADYGALIDRLPAIPGPYEARAAAFVKLGAYERAIEDYDRLLELAPGAQAYLLRRAEVWAKAGRLEKALEDYGTVLSAAPRSPEILLARGKCRLDAGDFTGAIADADAARKLLLFPAPELVSLRAQALIRQGRGQLALAELDALVAQNPQWRRQRADALVEAGDSARATADLNELLRLTPDSSELLLARGLAYESAGLDNNALHDLDAVITRDEKNAEAYAERARLLATTPEGSIRNGERALSDARKAAGLGFAPRWKSQDVLAAALAETGDFVAAVKAEETALAAGPPQRETAAMNERLRLYQKREAYRRSTRPAQVASATGVPANKAEPPADVRTPPTSPVEPRVGVPTKPAEVRGAPTPATDEAPRPAPRPPLMPTRSTPPGLDDTVMVLRDVLMEAQGQTPTTLPKGSIFVIEKVQGEWLWPRSPTVPGRLTGAGAELQLGWVPRDAVDHVFNVFASLTKAIEANPRSAESLRERASLWPAINLNFHKPSETNNALGVTTEQAHRFALQDLAASLAIEPGNAVAYALRARTLYELDAFLYEVDPQELLAAYGDALEHYRRAGNTDAVSDLLIQRAMRLRMMNKVDEAMADIQEYVRLNPTSARGYYARGWIYAEQKKTSDSERDYAQARRLKPDVENDWVWESLSP